MTREEAIAYFMLAAESASTNYTDDARREIVRKTAMALRALGVTAAEVRSAGASLRASL